MQFKLDYKLYLIKYYMAMTHDFSLVRLPLLFFFHYSSYISSNAILFMEEKKKLEDCDHFPTTPLVKTLLTSEPVVGSCQSPFSSEWQEETWKEEHKFCL